MKIYLVTDGDYSDYSVKGVFTDLKRAEVFRNHYNYGSIEEYETDPIVKENKLDNYRWYYNTADWCFNSVERVSNAKELDTRLQLLYEPITNKMVLSCECEAHDPDHVRKIAIDQVRAFLAGQIIAIKYPGKQVLYLNGTIVEVK